MSNPERCHHIKSNGVQCGSPALRNDRLCYFHRAWRPITLFPSKFMLPALEDAHSIQLAITRVIAMTLDTVIEPKMASTVLYALQIASTNLKHMVAEAPAPKDVVIDADREALAEAVFDRDLPDELPMWHDGETRTDKENHPTVSFSGPQPDSESEPNLPPGTIQGCAEQGRADNDPIDNGSADNGRRYDDDDLPLAPFTPVSSGQGAAICRRKGAVLGPFSSRRNFQSPADVPLPSIHLAREHAQ